MRKEERKQGKKETKAEKEESRERKKSSKKSSKKAETPSKKKQRHPATNEERKSRDTHRKGKQRPTTLKDSTRLISTFSTKLILDLGSLEILRQFAKMQLGRLRTQGVLNADRPEPANLWDMKRLED